jgi:hypothetical protein
MSLNGRATFNDESSVEPRWPIEIEVLNEPRIKHINASSMEPELFYKPSSPSLIGHRCEPFAYSLLGTNQGSVLRTSDDSPSRTVFNYNPESSGYVRRTRRAASDDRCLL